KVMWENVGIIRTTVGLVKAEDLLIQLEEELKRFSLSAEKAEIENILVAARLVTEDALAHNTEKIGAHWMVDRDSGIISDQIFIELISIQSTQDWENLCKQIVKIAKNAFAKTDEKAIETALINLNYRTKPTGKAIVLIAKIKEEVVGFIFGNLLESYPAIDRGIKDKFFGKNNTFFEELFAVKTKPIGHMLWERFKKEARSSGYLFISGLTKETESVAKRLKATILKSGIKQGGDTYEYWRLDLNRDGGRVAKKGRKRLSSSSRSKLQNFWEDYDLMEPQIIAAAKGKNKMKTKLVRSAKANFWSIHRIFIALNKSEEIAPIRKEFYALIAEIIISHVFDDFIIKKGVMNVILTLLAMARRKGFHNFNSFNTADVRVRSKLKKKLIKEQYIIVLGKVTITTAKLIEKLQGVDRFLVNFEELVRLDKPAEQDLTGVGVQKKSEPSREEIGDIENTMRHDVGRKTDGGIDYRAPPKIRHNASPPILSRKSFQNDSASISFRGILVLLFLAGISSFYIRSNAPKIISYLANVDSVYILLALLSLLAIGVFLIITNFILSIFDRILGKRHKEENIVIEEKPAVIVSEVKIKEEKPISEEPIFEDEPEVMQWWNTSFEEAKKEAEKTGRKMLIYFAQDISKCSACKMMQQEVFSDTRLQELLKNNFICVKIEKGEDEQIWNQYDVNATPTLIFTDSTGKEMLLTVVGGRRIWQIENIVENIISEVNMSNIESFIDNMLSEQARKIIKAVSEQDASVITET
ncbi:MAG: thioredoxin family protein, partial [Candidatus Omnitrophica bacterium]|nr:thioredoxin family protein [Candidatus Omnitrophota bacterium]